jgi:parallel beta-helix repeat protein
MLLKRFTIMLVLFLSAVVQAEDIHFFVSTEGDDRWSGRYADPVEQSDGPFATFERAMQAVRDLKAGDSLTAPVTVFFRGGTYRLKQPILFTPLDSGLPEAPITYRNYNDEKVILSGGRTVSGWQQQGNQWTVDLPEVLEQGVRFQQLFVNGERRFRARTPNSGYFQVKDPMNNPDWPFHHYRYTFGFTAGDLISVWRNLRDIEIVLLHFWSDAHCPIESIDPQDLTVTLATPAWRPFTYDYTNEGARYFVDNVYEGLDAPGEWYLDRTLGRLYYLPMPGEDMTTAQVIVPEVDQLLIFQGDPLIRDYVQHLHFRGLTLAHNDWFLPPGDPGDHQSADTVPGAIKIIAGRDISIEECSLEHLGTYAVEIRDGSRFIAIRRNRITDVGAGGIMVTGGRAGSDSLLKTSHITITNNRLYQLGRIYYAGVGMLIMHTSDNLIAHNEIKDLYYTGISVGLEWGYKPSAAFNNKIEFNHIEKAGQGLLSDMGGIYTLGISPGTTIRNNLVHDIYTSGYGGWGIYTDEGSSGILIEKNIVYDTKSAGFHQHYGQDNIVRNNIFAFGKIAQLMRSRDEQHKSFTFERNIVYWKNSGLLDKQWKGDTTNFVFRRNLYYRVDQKPVRFLNLSERKWQKRGQDVKSVFADPHFIDPEHGDFDLQDDSPAFKLGFQPIDMTAIGPNLWPDEVKEIRYMSRADSTEQPALFYDSGTLQKKPLVVALHTWSSDYRQPESVPYARWCIQKDWVFIHPDFRGPNRRPEATGSKLVIADILSAVDYAKTHASVDTTRIYLIGQSGGGYAALLMAAKAPQMWAGVSAWSSISDLKVWYGESLTREPRYAKEIAASCGGAPGDNEAVDEEYYKRSPLSFLTQAKGLPIDINAGIHDGHDGSVPISHSISAFNALAAPGDVIDAANIAMFVDSARVPDAFKNSRPDPYYGDNAVLLRRESNNARLTIFDGGHEILPNAALHWLQKQVKNR